MTSPIRLSRRQFVQRALAVSAAFPGLRSAEASGSANPIVLDRYGPLLQDPHRILDLPEGFSYRVISRAGDRMADGLLVPGFPDGMAAFSGRDGNVILVRNHELESKGADGIAEFYRRLGPYGTQNELFSKIEHKKLYDRGSVEGYPSIGGTTTLVYDPDSGRTVTEFLSLAGTERNCAGGVTPWGTWLTCEESDAKANDEFLADHGYVFEVTPTESPELQPAKAYEDMGRFRREAVAVDPVTGIVYQTEDRGDSLFYRFIPKVPGQLERGGQLQALTLADQKGADTRNWVALHGSTFPEGRAIDVTWIDLDDVRSPEDDLRHRGLAAGAALFARGEGLWFGDGVFFFACTSGGPILLGQIFKYTPAAPDGSDGSSSTGTLELFIESTDDNVIRSADNLTIAPWGDLIVCEDRLTESHLRGITFDGKIYTIARNALNGTEFAGACFAPDRSTMFVNLQKPGLTVAIDGPWEWVT